MGDVSHPLEKLRKSNDKLERSLARSENKTDDLERNNIDRDLKAAKNLCVEVMKIWKTNPSPQHKVQVEQELSRFLGVSKQIENRERKSMGSADGFNSNVNPKTNEELLAEANSRYQRLPAERDMNASFQQDMQVHFVEHDYNDLKQRETLIQKIESDIVEISGMSRDLQDLVIEQQEPLDSFVKHTESTRQHVDGANDQLLKSEENIRKSRRRKCGFLVCLIVAGAVTAIIVWLTSSPSKN